MLIVGFNIGYIPVSLGKQKTAKMPREFRRKSAYTPEKYITI